MTTLQLLAGPVPVRTVGPAASHRPPVVFVHGLLVNAELWTPVADRLAAQGLRSYAPTLPLGSHAVPMKPGADLSPRGVARIVLELLDRLDLTDVTLVGNDTGGAICQFLVDMDDSRIGRLVLTNCDTFENFPPAPFNLVVAAARRPGLGRALMAPMHFRVFRNSALGFGLLFHGRPDADLTSRWLAPYRADAGVRHDTATLCRGIRPADLVETSTRLGAFTRPVHLVWGDADRLFRLEHAERLAAVFPNATITRIPGGKTFVPIEHPDEVAAAITAVRL